MKEDDTRARFEGRVGELVSTDAYMTRFCFFYLFTFKLINALIKKILVTECTKLHYSLTIIYNNHSHSE